MKTHFLGETQGRPIQCQDAEMHLLNYHQYWAVLVSGKAWTSSWECPQRPDIVMALIADTRRLPLLLQDDCQQPLGLFAAWLTHALPRFWASPWVDWLSRGLGRPTDHVHWLWELRVLIGLIRVMAFIFGFLGAEWASPRAHGPRLREEKFPWSKTREAARQKNPTKTQKWQWDWSPGHTVESGGGGVS